MCPLSRFVGNEKAKHRLSRAAYQMWANDTHAGGNQAIAIIGEASTGKTTLGKLFAETVLLPYVDIQPKAVRSALDILEAIADVLDRTEVHSRRYDKPMNLRLVPDADKQFRIPPCVVHIDEVHALPNQVVQALLKATEPKDGMLAVGEGFVADCRQVTWVISTTDRGLLFDAFDTRFRKVTLHLYNKDDVAEIIRRNNSDWSIEVCRLVARYCWRVPREAIAFANDMRTEYDLRSQDGEVSWEDVAAAVARDNEIDPYGMTRQRLAVLTALGQQGSIPKNRLCLYANCKEEELVKFVMPALLSAAGGPALVTVTSKGYSLTSAGIKELDVRKIPNKGKDAVKMDVPALDFGDYDPEDFEVEDSPKPAA
jgi:Holliday junction resolvasome RuvABC ATP-dependent DNA helicase subunit